MENCGLLKYDNCFNVLSKLPIRDLLRLKCVCKSWCQLVSDHVFRRLHSRKKEPISGFLLQGYKLGPDNSATLAYIPVELRGAGLHQSIIYFPSEDVKVLASCNGLICYQGSSSSQDPALYVCNPLNKELIRLNWTKPDITGSIALAFDPCEDTRGSSTNFKLVRVQQLQTESEDQYFQFDICSSDTGSMTISQVTCHRGGGLCSNNVIFVGGFLHWWTYSSEILAFDVKKEKSCVISVPEPDSDDESDMLYASCMGESDGQLHYILVSDYGIEIWSLENYHKCEWDLKHSRSIEVIVEENPSLLLHEKNYMFPMVPLAFKDGYLLLECWDIYLYTVETTKMVKVLDDSDLHRNFLLLAFPYSMSLVPLRSA